MTWQSSSWKRARALVRPCPPAPLLATFTLSLGATKRGPPRTCLGTMVNAAAAAVVVAMNSRRVVAVFGCMVVLFAARGRIGSINGQNRDGRISGGQLDGSPIIRRGP